jgi:signal transduction histidine kinase
VSVKLISGTDREEAMVSVIDTGPGIAPEIQPRLFQRFQQAHQGTRGQPQGSGLGLALARQIIEHHGGKVGVKSEVGQGSEFYFLIPVGASSQDIDGSG